MSRIPLDPSNFAAALSNAAVNFANGVSAIVSNLSDANDRLGEIQAALHGYIVDTVTAKPKKPPKPKLAFHPDLIRWFEVLEQHPDRLGIVADWADENGGEPSVDLLAPALRFAWSRQRWPEMYVQYHWIVTEKSIHIHAADSWWLSTSNHKFAFTLSKKRRVGFWRVRRHSNKDILRYRTKGATLIEAFRQLAVILEPT